MVKVKLLYLITRATKSGPIQVVENILDYIDSNKFDLYLISIEKEIPERSILDTFKNRFRSYQYIPVSKKEALLGYFAQLRNAIKKINPDVVHSNGIVPDLIINKICPGKQLIIAHANYHVDYYYLCGKVKGELMAKLHIHLMKKARVCIACSESLSQIYKKDGLILPYIRNGVNIEPLKTYDKRELRKELGLPLNKKIYIYAASFNSRKNQEFLLTTFSKFLNDDILLLLGDGPTYESVKSVEHSNNVILAGRKSDVKPYLRASDYFISSSLQEGMPMGVLEGMAEGLPVVLSDIDQHRELFRVNKSIGVLFRNNSIESLMKAIKKIELMDYSKTSNNSYNTVLNHFNSKTMSEKYQQQYINIANNNR